MQKLKDWIKKLLNKPGSQGFTLIEVVIVMAIAGLIFVIVFLAVSAAQASRRDTARRSDASRLTAAVSQYQANNNGNLPADGWTGTSYYDAGTETTLSTGMVNDSSADGSMYFDAGTNCAGTNGTRNYRVLVKLERGGVTCVGS